MAILAVDFPRSIVSLADPESQRQLLVFLSGLTENLNNVLGNLDAGNFNPEVSAQIASLASVAEKTAALSKLINDGDVASAKGVRETYKSLRDSVFSNMDNITATFDVLIQQTVSSIQSYVQGNFVASDPNMTLEERISSLIQQTADQIRMEFNTQATINADAIDALSVAFSTYFRFSEAGMEIGKIGDGASQVVTRITNEQIQWVIAGTDVVLFYIDGATGKGHLNTAEIDTLSLGNPINGFIDIDMEANGLFFKWRS